MQVKNKSETRPYYVGTYVLAPGAVLDLDAKHADDIKDIDDLEVVEEKPSKSKSKDKDAE